MNSQSAILGLSLAYVLLGVLLLLGVTRARLPWTLKVALITLTSVFYVFAFFKTQALLGWPAVDSLPARFQLLWARTVEPNIVNEVRGTIYLWVEELDEANLPSGTPRAYALPYSAALADKVGAARAAIMNGHPQGGRASDFGMGGGDAPPSGTVVAPRLGTEPGGDPSGGGPLDPAFLHGDSKSVEFAPLPTPVLPPKDEP